MNRIWFVSTTKKIMKKHYNLGPDPKLKHRAQMGETPLPLFWVFMSTNNSNTIITHIFGFMSTNNSNAIYSTNVFSFMSTNNTGAILILIF